MGSFWSRRVRRLIPALVVTCLGVAIAAQFIDFGGDVRADLIGGLTYTSNWVLLAQGQSYADLFLAPSPLIHLWSLAIEEQFYIVLPVIVWLLARRAPWQVRTNLTVGAAVVVVVGIGLSQWVDDASFSYYGTLNRAPEIAVGVLLATGTRVTRDRVPGWLTGAALGALAVTLFAWRSAAVTDGWIAGGGLALFAVASATLVWAGSRPGPIATGLSIAPLRALGLISYGLYLYHWPVVVILSFPRVDMAPVPLFLLRVVVSLALAVASYHLIEQPLRRGRPELPNKTVLLSGLGALTATLMVVLLAVPPAADAPEAVAAPAVVAAGATAPDGPEGSAPSAPEPVPTPTVMLVGDSLPAWMIRDGGAALDPDQVTLVNGTLEACDGAASNTLARSRTGLEVPIPETCTGWPTQYPAILQTPSDVVVLMVGGHAMLDHQIEGSWTGPCEAAAQRWYRSDIAGRIRLMQEEVDDVRVVLPAWPDELSQWINPPDYLDRADCVRATLAAAAEETGAATIDFGAYVCPDGRDRCRPLRTGDGMHLDAASAGDALSWVVVQSLAPG